MSLSEALMAMEVDITTLANCAETAWDSISATGGVLVISLFGAPTVPWGLWPSAGVVDLHRASRRRLPSARCVDILLVLVKVVS